MLKRTQPHARNRRKLSPAQYPAGVNANLTVTVSTVTVTLTSDRPVMWKGIPLSFAVADTVVDSHTIVSDRVMTLTLHASGAGKVWSLGPEDPAIRTYSGGFANAKGGTFP